jgi:hypothetical protein
VARPAPRSRATWRGHTFTHRTVAMLRWVEDRSGLRLEPAQGSYNGGGVAASGGTHDREAVDLRVRNYTQAEITALVSWLRKAGFAAWYRAPSSSWGPHIHAVPIGGDLSAQAAYQVRAYDAKRDGLTGNRVDTAWRPKIKRRWSYVLGKPVPRI